MNGETAYGPALCREFINEAFELDDSSNPAMRNADSYNRFAVTVLFATPEYTAVLSKKYREANLGVWDFSSGYGENV
jgi:hypothetical protein